MGFVIMEKYTIFTDLSLNNDKIKYLTSGNNNNNNTFNLYTTFQNTYRRFTKV